MQALRPDPRYSLVSTFGVGMLTIENSQHGDSGQYHCELQNRLYGTLLSEESVQVIVNDCKLHSSGCMYSLIIL